LAVERARLALRLSPFDPFSYAPYAVLSMVSLLECRFDEAAVAARRAIENNPRFSFLHTLLAAALGRLGRIEDAKAVARQVLALQPNFKVSLVLGTFSVIGEERLAPFLEGLRGAGLPE
jgi:tetratricopeptide (TPR) repeat protein